MAAKLFVGNVSFTATESDLQSHFGSVGAVISVSIIMDRATGRSRGFAFVEMSTPEEAQKAIQELNQKDFQGRALTVKEAQPREERPREQRGYGRDSGGRSSQRGDRPRW